MPIQPPTRAIRAIIKTMFVKRLAALFVLLGVLLISGLSQVLAAIPLASAQANTDLAQTKAQAALDSLGQIADQIMDKTADPANPSLVLAPSDRQVLEDYINSITTQNLLSTAPKQDADTVGKISDLLPDGDKIGGTNFDDLFIKIAALINQIVSPDVKANLSILNNNLKDNMNKTEAVASAASMLETIRLQLDGGGVAKAAPPPIDIRVLDTLLYLVTPSVLGGAGHERIKVKSILAGYTGTEQNQIDKHDPTATDGTSTHAKGQALDISEIDTLKCTTIGKRHFASDKKTKQPPVPIKVNWQTDQGVAGERGYGSTANLQFSSSVNQMMLAALADMGLPLDPSSQDFSDPSLSGLLRYAGASLLSGVIAKGTLGGGTFDIQSTVKEYGRGVLASELDVPVTALRGDSSQQLIENIGRSVLEQRLNLPAYSLDGDAPDQIFHNLGLRFTEKNLGLKSGALAGWTPQSESQFQAMVGEAIIEDEEAYNLPHGSFAPTGSAGAIEKAVGSWKWNFLSQDLRIADNAVQATEDDRANFASGNLAAFVQSIGNHRVATNIYNYAPTVSGSTKARDQAWNLGTLSGIFGRLMSAQYDSALGEIGHEVLVQSVSLNESERAALRQYFKTGNKLNLPIGAISQSTGLTGAEFSRLFAGQGAHDIFDQFGRQKLQDKTIGSQNNSQLAQAVQSGAVSQKTGDELTFRQRRLQTIQNDAQTLGRSLDSQGKAATNQLQSFAQTQAKALTNDTLLAVTNQLNQQIDQISTLIPDTPSARDTFERLRCDVRSFGAGIDLSCGSASHWDNQTFQLPGQLAGISASQIVNLLNGKTNPADLLVQFGSSQLDSQLYLPKGTLNRLIGENARDPDSFMIAIGASRLEEEFGTSDPAQITLDSAAVDARLGLKSGTTASYRASQLPATALDQLKGDILVPDTAIASSQSTPIAQALAPSSSREDLIKKYEKYDSNVLENPLLLDAKTQQQLTAGRSEQDKRFLAQIGQRTVEQRALGRLTESLGNSGLVIAGIDLFGALTGNYQDLGLRLGSAKLDEALNLAPGTALSIFSATDSDQRQASLVNLGSQYLFDRLGIKNVDLASAINGSVSGSIAARRIESILGLDPNTVTESRSVVDIARLNGPVRMAQNLGLPLDSIIPDADYYQKQIQTSSLAFTDFSAAAIGSAKSYLSDINDQAINLIINPPLGWDGAALDNALLGNPDQSLLKKSGGEKTIVLDWLIGNLSTRDFIKTVSDGFLKSELTSPATVSGILANLGIDNSGLNLALNFWSLYQNNKSLVDQPFSQWPSAQKATLYQSISATLDYDLDARAGLTPGTIADMLANPQQAGAIALGEGIKLAGDKIGPKAGGLLAKAYNYYLDRQNEPKKQDDNKVGTDQGVSDGQSGLKSQIEKYKTTATTKLVDYGNGKTKEWAKKEFSDAYPIFANRFNNAVDAGDLTVMMIYAGQAELLKKINLGDSVNQGLPLEFQLTYPDLFNLTLGSDQIYNQALAQATADADKKFNIKQPNFATGSNLAQSYLGKLNGLNLNIIAQPNPDAAIGPVIPQAQQAAAYKTYRDQRAQELANQYRQEKRASAEYKIMDAMLWKVSPTIPAGFSQLMLTGTKDERNNALGALVLNKFIPESFRSYSPDILKLVNPTAPGDKNSASVDILQIFAQKEGVPLTKDQAQTFYNYLFVDQSDANYAALEKAGAPAVFEGYFNSHNTFGFQLPAGSMTDVFETYNGYGGKAAAEELAYLWGENKVFGWSDRVFGFSSGTTQTIHTIYETYSDLKDAGELTSGQEVAYAMQVVNLITGGKVSETFSRFDSQLDLPPGLSQMIFMYFLLPPSDPITAAIDIAVIVYQFAFGVYKTKVQCTADGYYPAIDNVVPPDLDVSGGIFDGASDASYRAGIKDGAQKKIGRLLKQIIAMPLHINANNQLTEKELNPANPTDKKTINSNRANQIITYAPDALSNATTYTDEQKNQYNYILNVPETGKYSSVYGTEAAQELLQKYPNYGFGVNSAIPDLVHVGF